MSAISVKTDLSLEEERVLELMADIETWNQKPVNRESQVFHWVSDVARGYLIGGNNPRVILEEVPTLVGILTCWLREMERSMRDIITTARSEGENKAAQEEERQLEAVRSLLARIQSQGGK